MLSVRTGVAGGDKGTVPKAQSVMATGRAKDTWTAACNEQSWGQLRLVPRECGQLRRGRGWDCWWLCSSSRKRCVK